VRASPSPSRSLRVTAVVVLIAAACTGDAAVTAPPGQRPTQPALLQPAIRLVVIDSTRLPFAGSAAERAAGHYVYGVRAAAPVIAPGNYVAGRQGGLYLDRVLAVSQGADRLALELAPARWSEVYPPLKIHIPFTRGAGSAPSPYGTVRWGPWQMVTRPPRPGAAPRAAPRLRTPAGAAIDPSDFDPFGFLLDHFDLCAAADAAGADISITGCGHISATVLDANFSLTGGVDVNVNLDLSDPLNPKLDASAAVNEQLNTLLDFQLSGNGSVELDVTPPDIGFIKEFTVAGLTGKVEVGFIIGVTGEIVGTTIEPHIQVSDTVSAGASLSTSNNPPFSFRYAGAGHFDAGVQVINLGDLGVKLAIGPKAEVKLDIAGDSTFSLEADADGFVEGHENLSGILGLQNWHVHTDAGTEAVLGAGVNIDLINLHLGGQETFPGPGINLVDLWGTGDLDVASSTSGKDIFPGQIYATSVRRSAPDDPPPWFAVLATNLGVNDSHLFEGGLLCRQFFAGAPVIPPDITTPQDCDVVATGHSVAPLSGIAWNCTAAQPSGVGVTVVPRVDFSVGSRLTSVALAVSCRSAYAVVRDIVASLFASGAINSSGVETALLSKLTAAEAYRDAGNPAATDSVLVALANQLSAQSGKHITTAADAELMSFDVLLRDCYETVVPTCSSVPAAVAAQAGR
jgi:hypothetical protein